MTDEPELDALIKQYNAELEYLDALGREYAQTFQLSASRLGMDPGADGDIHIRSLLEGVAFLTAKLHLHQQEQLRELARGLAELVSPALLRPVPSLGLVQLRPTRSDFATLADGRTGVSRGGSFRDSEGRVFRATEDVKVTPFTITDLRFKNLAERSPGRHSELTFTLATNGAFHEAQVDSLPLYLGDRTHGPFLYEYLTAYATEVRFAVTAAGQPDKVLRAEGELVPRISTGRTLDELGRPDAQDGHRLVLEYLVLPEKFCFIELGGLGAVRRELEVLEGGLERKRRASAVTVSVFFDRAAVPAPQLRPGDIGLHVLPVINLEKMQAEMIKADGRVEREIVVDRNQLDKYEIHSVLRVETDGQPPLKLRQVHGGKTALAGGNDGWFSIRRVPGRRSAGASARSGADTVNESGGSVGMRTYLTAVDPKGVPFKGVSLKVDVLACQRPITAGISENLSLGDARGPIAAKWLIAPSVPRVGAWRGSAGLDALAIATTNLGALLEQDGLGLRNLLATMVDPQFKLDRSVVDAVGPVETRSIARRLIDDQGHASVVRGIEVKMRIGAVTAAGGAALLGGIVQRFLSSLTTLNTFVEVVVVTGPQPKDEIRWPMIAGMRRPL